MEGLPGVHSHNMDFNLCEILQLVSGVVAATLYFSAPIYFRKQIFEKNVNTLLPGVRHAFLRKYSNLAFDC